MANSCRGSGRSIVVVVVVLNAASSAAYQLDEHENITVAPRTVTMHRDRRMQDALPVVSSITTSSTNCAPTTDILRPQTKTYCDRDYAFGELPEFLDGIVYIRTANDDKHSDPLDLEFLCFNTSTVATVYVLFDGRITEGEEPAWLRQSFEDEHEEVGQVIGGGTRGATGILNIRLAYMPAGRVCLGGNDAPGVGSNYAVAVGPVVDHSGLVTASSYVYMGCFADQLENGDECTTCRDFDTLGGYVQTASGPSQILRQCAGICHGYLYMGLQWSNECWCSNSYGHEGAYRGNCTAGDCEGSCDDPLECDHCGDQGDKCGRGVRNACGSANAVFWIGGTLVSLGTGDIEYVGCYAESDGGLDIEVSLGSLGAEATVELCAEQCSGYDYFALQHHELCFCDSEAPTLSLLDDSECEAPCNGNRSQACGGNFRNSVYYKGLAPRMLSHVTPPPPSIWWPIPPPPPPAQSLPNGVEYGWTLIFRQSQGNYRPVNEWLHADSFPSFAGDFSNLSEMESWRQADGKLTLKLVWPARNGSNTRAWKQTLNPVLAERGDSNIPELQGYEVLAGDVSPEANVWRGLRHGLQESSLLDGMHDGDGVLYAVGASHDFNGGIPGPSLQQGEAQVELYALWGDAPLSVRIVNITTDGANNEMCRLSCQEDISRGPPLVEVKVLDRRIRFGGRAMVAGGGQQAGEIAGNPQIVEGPTGEMDAYLLDHEGDQLLLGCPPTENASSTINVQTFQDDAQCSGGCDGCNGIDTDGTWAVTCNFKWPMYNTNYYQTLTRGKNGDHQVLLRDLELGSWQQKNHGFWGSGFRMDTLESGWHFLAVFGSGGSTRFFIDGREVGKVDWVSTTDFFSIANHYVHTDSQNQVWSGALHDLKIYGDVLAADPEVHSPCAFEHPDCYTTASFARVNDLRLYGDRDYTFSQDLPDFLRGADFIRSANADKFAGTSSEKGCADSPVGWISSDGKTCSTYALQDLCTVDGYGVGWNPDVGTFADFADANGVDAGAACCHCGGGEGPSPVECRDDPDGVLENIGYDCPRAAQVVPCNAVLADLDPDICPSCAALFAGTPDLRGRDVCPFTCDACGGIDQVVDDEFLCFSVTEAATIYVLYDSRATRVPGWLASDFRPVLPLQIVFSNAPGPGFAVYYRNVDASTRVCVGGNGRTDAVHNYIVAAGAVGVQPDRTAYTCDGHSLMFEAYEPPFSAEEWDAFSLHSVSRTVFEDNWAGWTPVVQHREVLSALWYRGENAFINEFDGFHLRDHYVMRWRGQIAIPEDGLYDFQTTSTDGSMLYIDQRLVVSNDGFHTPVDSNGRIYLAAGPHDITITFFEAGGGEMLEVSWSSTPGAPLTPLSPWVLSNSVGCSCHDGLFIEVFAPTDEDFNWNNLQSVEDTILDTTWNGWAPVLRHKELRSELSYADMSAFEAELPLLAQLHERFVVRWRGELLVSQSGPYSFQITSDGGSMLFLHDQLVVDNDGPHGMQTRTGSTVLSQGKTDMTVAYFSSDDSPYLIVMWTAVAGVDGSADLIPVSGDVLSNTVGCGPPIPPGAGDLFSGTYLCAAGTTSIDLSFTFINQETNEIQATAKITIMNSPCHGEYTMVGSLDGVSVSLSPFQIVSDSCDDLVPVGLTGVLDDTSFTGSTFSTDRVCGNFALEKVVFALDSCPALLTMDLSGDVEGVGGSLALGYWNYRLDMNERPWRITAHRLDDTTSETLLGVMSSVDASASEVTFNHGDNCGDNGSRRAVVKFEGGDLPRLTTSEPSSCYYELVAQLPGCLDSCPMLETISGVATGTIAYLGVTERITMEFDRHPWRIISTRQDGSTHLVGTQHLQEGNVWSFTHGDQCDASDALSSASVAFRSGGTLSVSGSKVVATCTYHIVVTHPGCVPTLTVVNPSFELDDIVVSLPPPPPPVTTIANSIYILTPGGAVGAASMHFFSNGGQTDDCIGDCFILYSTFTPTFGYPGNLRSGKPLPRRIAFQDVSYNAIDRHFTGSIVAGEDDQEAFADGSHRRNYDLTFAEDLQSFTGYITYYDDTGRILDRLSEGPPGLHDIHRAYQIGPGGDVLYRHWDSTDSTTTEDHWCYINPTGYESRGVALVEAGDTFWGALESPSGSKFVALKGNGSFVEQQIHGLSAGMPYEVHFMAAERPGHGQDEGLRVLIDGNTVWTSPQPPSDFTEFVAVFYAQRSFVVLRFENESPEGDRSVLIDNIGITVCSDCSTATQPPGPRELISSCDAPGDLYVTFLDDIVDRSWQQGSYESFSFRACLAGHATIIINGTRLHFIPFGAPHQRCPAEYQGIVHVDGHEWHTSHPTYDFPPGTFAIPMDCARVDLTATLQSGHGDVTTINPSEANDWIGQLYIGTTAGQLDIVDITVTLSCNEHTRQVMLYGSAHVTPSGVVFATGDDYATISSWDYAQDAEYTISIWMQKEFCPEGVWESIFSHQANDHFPLEDPVQSGASISISFGCEGAVHVSALGDSAHVSMLRVGVRDDSLKTAAIDFPLPETPDLDEVTSVWVHILMCATPTSLAMYDDGTLVANTVYDFPADMLNANLADPNPDNFNSALGRFTMPANIYIGSRSDRQLIQAANSHFRGKLAMLTVDTVAIGASQALCYFRGGEAALSNVQELDEGVLLSVSADRLIQCGDNCSRFTDSSGNRNLEVLLSTGRCSASPEDVAISMTNLLAGVTYKIQMLFDSAEGSMEVLFNGEQLLESFDPSTVTVAQGTSALVTYTFRATSAAASVELRGTSRANPFINAFTLEELGGGIENLVLRLTEQYAGESICHDDRAALHGFMPRICGAVRTSSWGWGGAPGRAIDGSTNTNFNSGSCSHTADGDTAPWFQIDLGVESIIDHVSVYHRSDCCEARLMGAQVVVSTTPLFEDGTLCAPLSDWRSVPEASMCNEAVGRFVTVTNDGPQYWLTICEIEVWGVHSSGTRPVELSEFALSDSAAIDSGILSVTQNVSNQHGAAFAPIEMTKDDSVAVEFTLYGGDVSEESVLCMSLGETFRGSIAPVGVSVCVVARQTENSITLYYNGESINSDAAALSLLDGTWHDIVFTLTTSGTSGAAVKLVVDSTYMLTGQIVDFALPMESYLGFTGHNGDAASGLLVRTIDLACSCLVEPSLRHALVTEVSGTGDLDLFGTFVVAVDIGGGDRIVSLQDAVFISESAASTPDEMHVSGSTCRFVLGEGIGGAKVQVGVANDAQACARLVQAAHPSANGASFPRFGSSACFAHFGMTAPNGNPNFENCMFGRCAGSDCNHVETHPCQFSTGDGIGGHQELVGYAYSADACAQMVYLLQPAANGATIASSGIGSCFAEIGMVAADENLRLQSCEFVDRPIAQPSWSQMMQGCVSGQNIVIHLGQDLRTCQAKCVQTVSCVAIQFISDVGECTLLSSQTVGTGTCPGQLFFLEQATPARAYAFGPGVAGWSLERTLEGMGADFSGDPCLAHTDCAKGFYCDTANQCESCTVIDAHLCNVVECGQSTDCVGQCCDNLEIIAHCPPDEYEGLHTRCSERPEHGARALIGASIDLHYVGCFVEDGTFNAGWQYRTSNFVPLGSGATPELCAQVCQDTEISNFTFAILTRGSACVCADTFRSSGVMGARDEPLGSVSNSECDVPCPGDPDQQCGSDWRSSVYHIDGCPLGFERRPAEPGLPACRVCPVGTQPSSSTRLTSGKLDPALFGTTGALEFISGPTDDIGGVVFAQDSMIQLGPGIPVGQEFSIDVWFQTKQLVDCITEAEKQRQTQKTFTYMGCFADDVNDRDMGWADSADQYGGTALLHLDPEDPGAALRQCAEVCTGFKYMGLQWTNECYCGDEYGKHGLHSSCEEDSTDTVCENTDTVCGYQGRECGRGLSGHCGYANAVYYIGQDFGQYEQDFTWFCLAQMAFVQRCSDQPHPPCWEGNSTTLVLPFSFPYFGDNWTEISVAAAGYLTLGTAKIVVFSDADAVYRSSVYVWMATDAVVVSFESAAICCDDPALNNSFQIILRPNGTIDMNYREIHPRDNDRGIPRTALRNADGSTEIVIASGWEPYRTNSSLRLNPDQMTPQAESLADCAKAVLLESPNGDEFVAIEDDGSIGATKATVSWTDYRPGCLATTELMYGQCWYNHEVAAQGPEATAEWCKQWCLETDGCIAAEVVVDYGAGSTLLGNGQCSDPGACWRIADADDHECDGVRNNMDLYMLDSLGFQGSGWSTAGLPDSGAAVDVSGHPDAKYNGRYLPHGIWNGHVAYTRSIVSELVVLGMPQRDYNGVYQQVGRWNDKPVFRNEEGMYLYFFSGSHGGSPGYRFDNRDQSDQTVPGSNDWHRGGWISEDMNLRRLSAGQHMLKHPDAQIEVVAPAVFLYYYSPADVDLSSSHRPAWSFDDRDQSTLDDPGGREWQRGGWLAHQIGTPPESVFDKKSSGCIKGENGDVSAGLTVSQCAEHCLRTTSCMAFEFVPETPSNQTQDYEQIYAGECRLQTGSDTYGCFSENMDVYTIHARTESLRVPQGQHYLAQYGQADQVIAIGPTDRIAVNNQSSTTLGIADCLRDPEMRAGPSVVVEGGQWMYATLDFHDPDDCGVTCQSGSLPLAPGWELAPASEEVEAVVASYCWGTHVMTTMTRGYNTRLCPSCSPLQQVTSTNDDGTFSPNTCYDRVLIRAPLDPCAHINEGAVSSVSEMPNGGISTSGRTGWHRLTAVSSTDGVQLYIDGVATGQKVDQQLAGTILTVGNKVDGSAPWGAISRLRVYDKSHDIDTIFDDELPALLSIDIDDGQFVFGGTAVQLDGDVDACVLCDVGMYDHDNSATTACLPCPAGKMSNNPGSSECSACDEGMGGVVVPGNNLDFEHRLGDEWIFSIDIDTPSSNDGDRCDTTYRGRHICDPGLGDGTHVRLPTASHYGGWDDGSCNAGRSSIDDAYVCYKPDLHNDAFGSVSVEWTTGCCNDRQPGCHSGCVAATGCHIQWPECASGTAVAVETWGTSDPHHPVDSCLVDKFRWECSRDVISDDNNGPSATVVISPSYLPNVTWRNSLERAQSAPSGERFLALQGFGSSIHQVFEHLAINSTYAISFQASKCRNAGGLGEIYDHDLEVNVCDHAHHLCNVDDESVVWSTYLRDTFAQYGIKFNAVAESMTVRFRNLAPEHNSICLDSVSVFESNACVACSPGLYDADGDGSGDCTPCPAGSYTNASSQIRCTPCASGTSPSGSTAAEDCHVCPSGRVGHSATGVSLCIDCPIGTFRGVTELRAEPDATQCRPCPISQSTAQVGSTVTAQCQQSYCTDRVASNYQANPGFGVSDCRYDLSVLSRQLWSGTRTNAFEGDLLAFIWSYSTGEWPTIVEEMQSLRGQDAVWIRINRTSVIQGRTAADSATQYVMAGGRVVYENATDAYSYIRYSLFAHNRAERGGAVNAYNTAVSFDHVHFEHNTAARGGAIYAASSGGSPPALILEATMMMGNIAQEGGAIWIESMQLIALQASFENNQATNTGGALFVRGSASSLTLTNATFRDEVSNDITVSYHIYVANNVTLLRITDTNFFGSTAVYTREELDIGDCVHNPCESGFECIYEKSSLHCSPCSTGHVTDPDNVGIRCVPCAAGHIPNSRRDQCESCPSNAVTTQIGVDFYADDCTACGADKVAKDNLKECRTCDYRQVAVNGVCKCAEGFYNSSKRILSCAGFCSELIDVSGCEPCPSCVRCPVGADGKSSTPLLQPGFGIMAQESRSIAQIMSEDSPIVNSDRHVEIYNCPLLKMCNGDMFVMNLTSLTDNVIREYVETLTCSAYDGCKIPLNNDFNQQTIDTDNYAAAKQLVAHLKTENSIAVQSNLAALSGLDGTSIANAREVWESSNDPDDYSGRQLRDALLAYYQTMRSKNELATVTDSFRSAHPTLGVNATSQTTFSCRTGHNSASPLCALCDTFATGTDYELKYVGGSTSLCNPCKISEVGYRVLGVLAVLVIAWVACVQLPMKLFARSRAKKAAVAAAVHQAGFVLVGASAEEPAPLQVYAKIVVSHIQVLTQFHIVLGINFPAQFQSLLDTLAVLKGDFLSYINVKCAVEMHLYSEFILAMLLVPMCGSMLVLYKRGRQKYQKYTKAAKSQLQSVQQPDLSEALDLSADLGIQPRDSNSSDAKTYVEQDGILSTMFVLLFFVYPLLATRIFHMFSCMDMGNQRFHIYDYSINCNSTQYNRFRWLAIVCIVIYPLGVPLVTLWILFKNRGSLEDTSSHQPGICAYSNSEAKSETVSWGTAETSTKTELQPWWKGDRSTFEFLVRDYQPHFFYFETVEYARKLALTGLVMVAPRGSATQIVFSIFISFLFAIVNAALRPFADKKASAMRMLADMSLFFTLVCVLLLHFKGNLSNCEWLTEDTVGWLLVVLNFIILIFVISAEVFRRLLHAFSEKESALSVGIRYKPSGHIGHSGSHAKVYHGEYKPAAEVESIVCAVKIRNLNTSVLNVESRIQHECQHTNIVRLFHAEVNGSLHYLAMELADCSLEDSTDIGEHKCISVCRGIVEGIQALHDAGWIHTNLIPANVLMIDGHPRIAGFSSAQVLNVYALTTRINTIHGSIGFQSPEIIRGKNLDILVEVADPVAVDAFSTGCTLFFVLANHARPFHFSGDEKNVEMNVLAGDIGFSEVMISPEGEHLVASLLNFNPALRPSMARTLEHPLFWETDAKLKYLGDTIGSTLGVRFHRSAVPFVADLEAIMDQELGAYNELAPEDGGSWSQALGTRYPLGGDWGKSQRPPHEEERNYFIYGAPPSKKQAREREKQVAQGRVTGAHAAKEIRTVGLLKFMRNVNAHRAQMVDCGRFEDEDAVVRYLLDPFPWLFMAVYKLDLHYGVSKHATEVEAKTAADLAAATEVNPLEIGGRGIMEGMRLEEDGELGSSSASRGETFAF